MRKLYKSDQVALDSIEAYYCSCSCSNCACPQCSCSCNSGDAYLKTSVQFNDAVTSTLLMDNRSRNTYGPSTLQS